MNSTKGDTKQMTSENELSQEEAELVSGGALLDLVPTPFNPVGWFPGIVTLPARPPIPLPPICDLDPECGGTGPILAIGS